MWVETAKGLESLAKGRSSSLWGCELKHRNMVFLIGSGGSSSLWGCELKHHSPSIQIYTSGHPPCEDVSWNNLVYTAVLLFLRHPPCEDVSWNILSSWTSRPYFSSSSLWGCELKRETCTIDDYSFWSSSLWGCELKRRWNRPSWWCGGVILLVRMWVETAVAPFLAHTMYCHPPCEDVSWNTTKRVQKSLECVILLVRMWVETWNGRTGVQDSNVILLVRMWVETVLIYVSCQLPPSSSLWGCELKQNVTCTVTKFLCHPPCEDVSWNDTLTGGIDFVLASFSLWGCELKHDCEEQHGDPKGHPPCEDVSWKTYTGCKWLLVIRHPPCEDVSWKENDVKMYGTQV